MKGDKHEQMSLLVIIAIVLPPLAVGLKDGFGFHLFLNIVLTLLFYVPGLLQRAAGRPEGLNFGRHPIRQRNSQERCGVLPRCKRRSNYPRHSLCETLTSFPSWKT